MLLGEMFYETVANIENGLNSTLWIFTAKNLMGDFYG